MRIAELDEARRYEKKVAGMSVEEFLQAIPGQTVEQAQDRIEQAKTFVAKLPYNPLQDELDARSAVGDYCRVTMREMVDRLKSIGYKLDRDMDCRSVARWMTGSRAGKSYPSVNMRPVQIDDGLAFCHFEARRDANFKALQEMRGQLFVAGDTAIYEF